MDQISQSLEIEEEDNSDNEQDQSSSDELMPQVFNPDDCEDSEALEAVQYLLDVRKQAKSAKPFTQSDKKVEILKNPDPKYLVKPYLCNNSEQQFEPNQWESEVMQNFKGIKQNIQCAREWKQSVGYDSFQESIQDLDLIYEKSLAQLIRTQKTFVQNLRNPNCLLPTLNLIVNIDHVKTINLLQWIAFEIEKLKDLNYQHCFWSYCILSQLDAPVNSESTSNINLILRKAKRRLNFYKVSPSEKDLSKTLGMLHTLVTIIKYEFRQFFIE